MRVLVMGGGGMLGHKVAQQFSSRFETIATLRGSAVAIPAEVQSGVRWIEGVDATDQQSVRRTVTDVAPDVIVNCVGIVKQLAAANDPVSSISVNSLSPHVLAAAAREAGARLIHVSTDCVFAGTRGGYSEEDTPDARDLYGRSKLLGEVGAPHLTLRTSIIGRELTAAHGLVEWFLSQKGKPVSGYRHAIFSGLTTLELTRVMAAVITDHSTLEGLHHVAAAPVAKYDLLRMLNAAFDARCEIVPDESVVIDRSLSGARFTSLTGIAPKAWSQMVDDMAEDGSQYDVWRQS